MSAELTPAMFHIALVLAGGPRHGYALMSEVAVISNDQMRIGPGTLYRTLQRMQADGYIREVPAAEDAADARRRCYELTSAGRRALVEQTRHLATLVQAAAERGLLSGQPSTPSRRSHA